MLAFFGIVLNDLPPFFVEKPVDDPNELFAGTTRCHELAAEFLTGFGVPYEVVGGNHDLEGIDEFKTDKANLEVGYFL